MDRWQGKTAVVTGASSGFGAVIAQKLVEHGLLVAGLARRIEKVEELAKTLACDCISGKLFPIKCDVTNEDEVIEAFKWIKCNIGVVHILINNAGVLRDGFLHNGSTADWRLMFDTNVLGLCIATREAVQQMLSGAVAGHVVHMNSIAGHTVTQHDPPSGNVYPATKFAVTALTEQLRQEMVWLKNQIKVTSISPGLAKTEIFTAANSPRFNEDSLNQLPHLLPEDVANAVMYVLGTPPHVQIKELTIKPTGEDV